MRQFNLDLKGEKLIKFYIWYILIFVIFFSFVFKNIYPVIQNAASSDPMDLMFKIMQGFGFLSLFGLLIAFAGLIVKYYFILFSITNMELGEEKFSFSGGLGEFLGINIAGIILSIVTLGIYYSWYMKNLVQYFARNTRYKDDGFIFNGEGGEIICQYPPLFFPSGCDYLPDFCPGNRRSCGSRSDAV